MRGVLTLLVILSTIEFKSAKIISGFASDTNVLSETDIVTWTDNGNEDTTQYTTFGISENPEINFLNGYVKDETTEYAEPTTEVSTIESTTCQDNNCNEVECGLEVLDVVINRTKNSFAMALVPKENFCNTRYYIHLTKAYNGSSKDVPYFRGEDKLFHKFKKKLLQCTAYNISIEVGFRPVYEKVIWTLPGEVKNVTVSVKKNSTEVTWPASDHPDCSDYNIYVNDALFEKTSKTSYKFNGQLYCTKFGVSIVGSDNNVGKRVTGIEPGPVTDLKIIPNDTSLVISWGPPEINNCGTIDFVVELGTSTKETKDTTIEFENLESCTSYTVEVSAKFGNTFGESVNKSATTTTPTNILGVQNFKFEVISEVLNVTWKAPSKQEACIKKYRVLLWGDDGVTTGDETTEKYYEFQPLIGCMTYNVQITPIVSESQEGQSEKGVHKIEALPTKPPTLKNIEVDKTWASMSFALEVFSANRCKITKVSVSCKGVNNANHPWVIESQDAFLDYVDSDARPDATINVKDLSEYTNYSCEAVVENEGGISENSKPIEFQTHAEVPGAPQNLILTMRTNTGFTVTWDEPEKVPGILENYKIETITSRSLHYIPEECLISDNTTTSLNEPDETSHDVEKAHSNFEYIIEVSAMTIDYGPSATLYVYTSPSASEVPRTVKHDFINILGEKYDVTLLLNWSLPCNTKGNLSLFEVETFGHPLENPQEDPFYKSENIDINKDPEDEFYYWELPGIKASFNYTVLIKAYVSNETDDIEGEASEINFMSPDGYPSAPVNVEVSSETDISVVVSWDEPLSKNGELQEYNVTIASVGPLHDVADDCDIHKFFESYIITSTENYFEFVDGVPNYRYTVVISASTNAGFGIESDAVSFQTLTSDPEAVRDVHKEINFEEHEIYNADVNISFSKPCNMNGKFLKYNVTLVGRRAEFNDITLEAIIEEYTTNTITFGLKPQYEYVGGIQVINSDFAGEMFKIEGFNAPAGVPLDTISKLHVPEASGSQTASFVLNSDLFDITNGDILYYALILSLGKNEENATDGTYGFWDGSTWPTIGKWSDENVDVYQTNEEFWNPFNNKDVNNITFYIGTQNCTGVTSFCNGPLTAATEYNFKVRGFTNRGYRDTTTVRFLTPADLEKSIDLALILGLVFGILALLILIIFICCMWRKKKKEKHDKIINDNMPYIPLPVTTKQFPEHYDNYKQNIHKFKEEFSLLSKWCSENTPLTTVGLSEENKKKNRYINILPYDDTRVTLASDKNANYTDYINASFIKGYSGSIEYIATQGPLESTIVDFWRMVMQENISVIVMVAQFVEQSKQKCHKYFPDNHEIMELDDGIEIRCSNELNFGPYIVRSLLVQRDLTKWTITHLQFVDWPDFGCPNGTQAMLQFCSVMRQHIERDKSKTIIHCSAGVGRTGTLIAIDVLLQTIENKGDIDVFKTVCNLRMQRSHMVQTEKQYIYIHSCIKDSILNPVKIEVKQSEPIYENIDLLQGMLNDKVIAESAL